MKSILLLLYFGFVCSVRAQPLPSELSVSRYLAAALADESSPSSSNATVAGGFGFIAGAAAMGYLSWQISPPDTSGALRYLPQVLAGAVGGAIGSGLTVHLMNGRDGNLPLTIGGALLTQVVVLGGDLLLIRLAQWSGNPGLAEIVGWLSLPIIFGAPFITAAGADYADRLTR